MHEKKKWNVKVLVHANNINHKELWKIDCLAKKNVLFLFQNLQKKENKPKKNPNSYIYCTPSTPSFEIVSLNYWSFFSIKQSLFTEVSLHRYPPSSWGVRSVACPSGNWGCPVSRSASPWSGSGSKQGHPHISQPFMNTR